MNDCSVPGPFPLGITHSDGLTDAGEKSLYGSSAAWPRRVRRLPGSEALGTLDYTGSTMQAEHGL
jgi:hypothetical protein